MITVTLDQKTFKPDSRIKGTVTWQLDKTPKNISVRLFWYTRGRGTEDVQLVDETQLGADRQGQRGFDLQLPEGPYSFSGKLISLIWGVEAVVQPGGECSREEIIVSPVEKEIILGEKV
ncbi:MAG: hypothetical protein AB7S78_13335 [Candidatus Omnitrophota bacterium]